jgi:hypothetical protein
MTDASLPVRARKALEETLSWSHGQNYAGYNKHDGLNSPLLRALLGWARWPRLVAIQSIMRAPVNLRPLLGVPRTKNPKGLGLFASAWLDLNALEHEAEESREATALLEILLAHPAEGFKGLSWGYPYPWQDVGFYAPTNFPNRVVTCWIGFAFAEAARQTGQDLFLDALGRIATFLLEEPNRLRDTPAELCFSYVPDPSVTWAVVDVPALAGAFLAEASVLLGREDLREPADRLITWVLNRQTDYGAWFYTDPPGDSHITHDNYHTGIILDCLDRYRTASGDERIASAWEAGMAYYRDHLFEQNGAPRWMNETPFPHDVHGAASGILCFCRASRRLPEYAGTADRILNWTLETLYSGDGRFWYQETKRGVKRFCLMRWCNAWMARAIAYWFRIGQETKRIEDGASKQKG